jgi:hypothetical protein
MGRIPNDAIRASDASSRMCGSARALLLEHRSLALGCASRGDDDDAAHITCGMTPNGMKMRVKGTSGVLQVVARVRPPTRDQLEIELLGGDFGDLRLAPGDCDDYTTRALYRIVQDPPSF